MRRTRRNNSQATVPATVPATEKELAASLNSNQNGPMRKTQKRNAAVIEDFEPECGNIFVEVARSQRDALEIYLTDDQKIIYNSAIEVPTKSNRKALYALLADQTAGPFKDYYEKNAQLFLKLNGEACGPVGECNRQEYVKLCDKSIDAIAARVEENRLLLELKNTPPPVSTEDIELSDIFSVEDETVYVNKAMLKLYMGFKKSPEEYLADTKRFLAFAYEYVGYDDIYSQIMDLVSALETENKGVKDTQKIWDKALLKKRFAEAAVAGGEAATAARATAETAEREAMAAAGRATAALNNLKIPVNSSIDRLAETGPTPETRMLILNLPLTKMTPQFISSNLSGDKQTITENSSKKIRLEQLNISIPVNLKQPYDIYGSGFVIERINSIQYMKDRILYLDPELFIKLEHYTKDNLYYLELALKIIIKIEGIFRTLTNKSIVVEGSCLDFLIYAYLSCVKVLVLVDDIPPITVHEVLKKFILLLFDFMNKLKIRDLETILTHDDLGGDLKEFMELLVTDDNDYGTAKELIAKELIKINLDQVLTVSSDDDFIDAANHFTGYTIYPIFRGKNDQKIQTALDDDFDLRAALGAALTSDPDLHAALTSIPATFSAAIADAFGSLDAGLKRDSDDRPRSLLPSALAAAFYVAPDTNFAERLHHQPHLAAALAAALPTALATVIFNVIVATPPIIAQKNPAAVAALPREKNQQILYADAFILYVDARAAAAAGAALQNPSAEAAAYAEMYAHLAINLEKLRLYSHKYVCEDDGENEDSSM